MGFLAGLLSGVTQAAPGILANRRADEQEAYQRRQFETAKAEREENQGYEREQTRRGQLMALLQGLKSTNSLDAPGITAAQAEVLQDGATLGDAEASAVVPQFSTAPGSQATGPIPYKPRQFTLSSLLKNKSDAEIAAEDRLRGIETQKAEALLRDQQARQDAERHDASMRAFAGQERDRNLASHRGMLGDFKSLYAGQPGALAKLFERGTQLEQGGVLPSGKDLPALPVPTPGFPGSVSTPQQLPSIVSGLELGKTDAELARELAQTNTSRGVLANLYGAQAARHQDPGAFAAVIEGALSGNPVNQRTELALPFGAMGIGAPGGIPLTLPSLLERARLNNPTLDDVNFGQQKAILGLNQGFEREMLGVRNAGQAGKLGLEEREFGHRVRMDNERLGLDRQKLDLERSAQGRQLPPLLQVEYDATRKRRELLEGQINKLQADNLKGSNDALIQSLQPHLQGLLAQEQAILGRASGGSAGSSGSGGVPSFSTYEQLLQTVREDFKAAGLTPTVQEVKRRANQAIRESRVRMVK